jgi:hypothetical protein
MRYKTKQIHQKHELSHFQGGECINCSLLGYGNTQHRRRLFFKVGSKDAVERVEGVLECAVVLIRSPGGRGPWVPNFVPRGS